MPMMDPWPGSPYYLLVNRAGHLSGCKVWPAHSLTPLPPLTVPLIHPDPAVSVAMQGLVDSIYRRSRYDRDIDYRTLRHSLAPAEITWLDQKLLEYPAKP